MSDLSENQVLLQWDSQQKIWNRLPPQAVLSAGERLLALPAFRPLIALTAGLTIHLRDGTEIDFQTIEKEESPQLEIRYGRVVASTVGKPETRLPLKAGNLSGVLVFVDPESRVAIEAVREPSPGADPEKEPTDPIVNLYAMSGRLIWESGDGLSKVEFKTPSQLTLSPTGSGPATPLDQFPQWAVSSSGEALDRLAARSIEEVVQVDRPVALGLKEKLDHRKREVRWLAARSLSHVGDFEPLVETLDDPEQKLVWSDYLEQLGESIGRGPESAAAVRESLQAKYKEDGDKIYRILWGYTTEQLAEGQDAQLVETLGSELLAARRAAIWRLMQITGARLYFYPEDTPVKRQKAIRAWEKRLRSGEIRLKSAVRGSRTPASRGGASAGP